MLHVLIASLLIFCARVIDVSFGTVKVIYVAKGKKYLAPVFAFLEIIVWLVAARQVLVNEINIPYLFAYACGYAMGNYAGVIIEEKLAVGKVAVRIIVNKGSIALISNLREAGYSFTILEGEWRVEKVEVVFAIVDRKNLKNILSIIEKNNPSAFYSIQDVQSAREGFFQHHSNGKRNVLKRIFNLKARK